MAPRSDLQTKLESLSGVQKVYFQPPENVKLVYPCIVYNRDGLPVQYADNSPYHLTTKYEVTVMDRDPDSSIPRQVLMLPLCSHDRSFAVADLNHDVFTLYF